MPSLPNDDTIKVAVVTGGHLYEVPGFHHLFRELPGNDAYIQGMEDWSSDVAQVRERYDVTLFYNMHMQTPTGEEPAPFQKMRAALEDLGANGRGIFILHHALLAFPGWPLWSEIVGIPDRRFGFHHSQTLGVEVANGDHSITRGLAPFETVDESYTMNDAGEGSEILLTVDHPKSMKTIAWTRQHRASRVFCFELGHDTVAWTNAGFREVVTRGIRWCAGRI